MASINSMNFRKLSRRDDLISLGYLLIYMIQGSLSFIPGKDVPYKNQFNYIRNLKSQLTLDKLCQTLRAKLLIDFIKVIMGLAFEEKPDYEKLRKILHKVSEMKPPVSSA